MRVAVFVLVGTAAWSSAETASAQRQLMAGSIALGTGIEMGSGQGGQSVMLRAPLFVDVALRAWVDERPSLLYGGSLRIEVDSGTAVAAVPRVELRHDLGPVVLMPGLGAPFFFAPFSMVGLEASLSGRLPLVDGLSVLASMFVDAYFFGSDVPSNSIVFMFNFMVGGQLEF